MILSGNDMLWDKYIEKLPEEKQDIYFTRQYCCLSQQLVRGEAQLFVYEKGENFILYPFIKRPIQNMKLDKVYYDIETPYGYGGPIIKYEDSILIHDFESAFLEFCLKENIIAEFIRFHPLLKNELFFQENVEILHNRTTVWLDLKKNLDDIWKQEISSTCRNRIRKCEKNGLEVEISDNYDEFVEIYNQTMHKVGAGEFYFFDKQYYDGIRNNPNCILMRGTQNKAVLAGAIFMKYKDYFHFHLGGSKREFLKLAPNNILMWSAIKYAKLCGCKKMHFGGGLTDSKEDSLFRFKSTFSSSCADFYIGKRVHNREIYKKLIQKWEDIHGEKAKILLQYHENR